MSVNLLELLKGQIGDQVVKQASSFLGESEDKTQSAMDNILPSMLGGMMSKASTKDGASALFNMLGESAGDSKGGMMGNVMDMLGGGDSSSMMEKGGSLLSGLFGDKLGGIVNLISGASGMSASSSSSLMGMAAPMIMGILGKTKNSMGLDAGGMAGLLMSQKDHLKDALPSGFAESMGIGSLDGLVDSAKGNLGGMLTGMGGKVLSGASETVDAAANLGKKTISSTTDTVGEVASGASGAAESAAATGTSWMKWLLPVLLVLGALYFLRQGCSDSVSDATNSAINSTQETITAAGDKAGDFAGGIADKAGDAAGAVGDAAGAVAAKAGDAAGAVADKAGDAAGAVADKAGDAAGAVGGAIKDGVSKVKLASGEAIDFVKGSFGDKFASFITSGNKDLKTVFTLDNLTFRTGSAVLDEASFGELDNLAKVLAAYPTVNIRLEGHTDNKGNAAKNKTLSQQRADAAKAYLVKKGVKADRMATKGYGAEKPAASNDTEEGRIKNRRTDVVITKR